MAAILNYQPALPNKLCDCMFDIYVYIRLKTCSSFPDNLWALYCKILQSVSSNTKDLTVVTFRERHNVCLILFILNTDLTH